ncbi:hypothetical protein [Rhizobium sp. SGZ-381]|uniref:hypothetical protein n=1 Tax=Rhizobium sp. SGZ-381 TaxID=3342800 RepID=UPI003671A8DB
MSLLKELAAKASTIETAGHTIREDALKRGASFSYIDPSRPDVIVVETSDDVASMKAKAFPRKAQM